MLKRKLWIWVHDKLEDAWDWVYWHKLYEKPASMYGDDGISVVETKYGSGATAAITHGKITSVTMPVGDRIQALRKSMDEAAKTVDNWSAAKRESADVAMQTRSLASLYESQIGIKKNPWQ